jgi:hypothetical protein
MGSHTNVAELLAPPLGNRLTRLRLGLASCDVPVLHALSALTGLTHLTLATNTGPQSLSQAQKRSISFPNLLELTSTILTADINLAIIRASRRLRSVTCAFDGTPVQLRGFLEAANEHGVQSMDIRTSQTPTPLLNLWMGYRVARPTDFPLLPKPAI